MDTKEILIQSLIDQGYLKTPRIIDAFRAIDRADFVLPEYREEAYGNYPLPIGQGQTISQPLTVAFLFELLDPRPGEKILDIGSGSGWTSTLLAYITNGNQTSRTASKGKVYAMERIEEICRQGENNAKKYNFVRSGIVTFFCKDASEGLPAYAPYEKILAGAAASRDIPSAWRAQVKIGGRIVAPVGGSVWLFIKKSEKNWEEKEFPGFAFVPLLQDKKQMTHTPTRATNTKGERVRRWPMKQLLLSGMILFAAFAAFAADEIYRPHASSETTITVTQGMGSRKIGALLKQEGIIRSKWIFVSYVSLKGIASGLKPGRYTFTKATIPEIVQDLTKGGISERSITIPEGWTIHDIAEYFNEEGIAENSTFKDLVGRDGEKDFVARFDFLKDKPVRLDLEGYLFPDTYRIFTDTTARAVALKMLENFGKKLTPELRGEILRQKKTVFEIVTMASLIEKEVILPEDRAMVSGILWKRIKIGIPLQVDATIVYIKEQRAVNGTKSAKVSIADTKIDSPYNTYRYRGLPKGPIANPGLSAIRAAIFPKESPYLYYLSTPEGHTIFSRTLEEHNIAKARYLR